MAKIINDAETKAVDATLYIQFMKLLMGKYGNFKMSQELHNMVIWHLCEICEEIEYERDIERERMMGATTYDKLDGVMNPEIKKHD